MDNKLKKLEIKRLLQEYNFLMTDDEYKKELVDEHKSTFLEQVAEVKKDIPPSPPKEQPKEQAKKEDKIDPNIVSSSTKKKVRKIYREIVKVTHPDKINSDKYLDIYVKATKAADDFNIFDLFQICVELNIEIELDFEDTDVLNFLIQSKKNEIKKVESSFIWLWINAKTEQEKDKLVKLFVQQTS